MRARVVLQLAGISLFISVCSFNADAATKKPKKNAPKPEVSAGPECKSKLLIDAASGDVLFEENAHEPMPPASMVKLMTSYVMLKQIQDGGVKADDVITVSRNASKIGGSQVYLKEGEQFTLDQLLQAVLIQSANDGATAIAEHIGGSSEGFAELMNQQAQSLGMTESKFYTPHGLPPGEGQSADLVSAHDFGILSRALLKEFPKIIETTKLTEAEFRGGEFRMANHNKLLQTFPGCDGFKTGYYGQAGFSVTATALRNNMRMIAVVMGCKERKKRDAEASRLLSMGFTQYKTVKLIDRGIAIEQAAAVDGGVVPSVIPVTGSEFKAVVRAGQEANIERKVELCTALKAPIAPNTPCGSMSFLLAGRELGKIALTVPVEIPAMGMRGRLKRMLGLGM